MAKKQDNRKMEVVAPIMGQLEKGRCADVEELHVLYRIYVCATITDEALLLMREREIRRYVALGAHRAARDFYTGARHAVLVRIIARACGVAEVSVYQWVAAGE